MSRELGLSVRTTKRAVARLQALGLVDVQRAVGRTHTNRYVIHENVPKCHLLDDGKGVKLTPEKVTSCPEKGDKLSPKKKKEKSNGKEKAFLSCFFDSVWDLYPEHRRGNRGDAVAAWNSLIGPEEDYSTAIKVEDGLKAWVVSDDWTKDDGTWVPKVTKFITERKWAARPVATGPEQKPCYRCRGRSVNYSHDDGGGIFWFCRACQPNVKGKLPRDLPTG